MIGFIFLLLALRQIYIIIKNGLTAKQVKEAGSGQGVLVLVHVNNSDVVESSYLTQLERVPAPHKVHFIVKLDHPQILEFGNRSFKIESFDPRVETSIDVINRLCAETHFESILISDGNILFNEQGLFGVEKLLHDHKGPFCILPQVHSNNLTVDCLYTLNPNLALISLLSFKKLTRSQQHPLLNISELSIAFRKIDFQAFPENSFWKSSLFYSFRERAIGLKLCFGEKLFSIYLGANLNSLWPKMMNIWKEASLTHSYTAASFIVQLLVWSFPLLFFKSYPFYAIAIFFLLLIFRIFTLIIFQENLMSIIVHPIAGVMWLASFVWNKIEEIRNLRK